MNNRQINNSINIEPYNKTVRPTNGYSELEMPFSKLSQEIIDSDTNLLHNLQKMEESNAQLEELVEDGRKRLTEIISTYARSLKILAHDLRNPLSTTIGILDLLKESFEDWNKTEIELLINSASDSAINTFNLLDNLLVWSMSQNVDKDFNPIRIDLRDLVINQIEFFSKTASLKQIRMKYSVDPGLYVAADFEMVKTIFRNLISNAIKYTPNGGIINITAREGKKFVKIEVIDNGIGMMQKTKERLFKLDEFKSESGTNNEPGTGLGLLFCKEFIDMHGGKLLVESKPGIGSKFKFTLPHYI